MRLSSTKSLVFLVMIFALVACNNQQGPRLLPAPTVNPELTIVLGPTPTPGPQDFITGRWDTIISETQTHERDGVSLSVKQLRFSWPEKLFAEGTLAGLGDEAVANAQSIIGIRVNVLNETDEDVEFFPGGQEAELLVNGERVNPSEVLTEAGGEILAGDIEGFVIIFPIAESSLDEIKELTYSIQDMSFHYTDLVLAGP